MSLKAEGDAGNGKVFTVGEGDDKDPTTIEEDPSISGGDGVGVVNGKMDLGVRKLVVCHVENATSLFAYQSAQSPFISQIKLQLAEAISHQEQRQDNAQPPLKLDKFKTEEEAVAAFSDRDKIWYRAKVETLNVQGKIRVRYVDFGFNELLPPENLRPLPEKIRELPVYCQKYRMADLKPKGRADGFSAQDRERGAKWLRKIIGDDVVKASCHEVLKYKGGIMMDAEVNGHNLNNLALKKGFAVPSPGSVNGNKFYVGGGYGVAPPAFRNRIPDDQDYLDYGVGGVNKMPKNKNNNKKIKQLKGKVTSLEASLGKRKEEMEKMKNKNVYENLGGAIEKVRDLRGNSNLKERIKDSARLLDDIFQTLKTLAIKSVEAENASTALRQIKEQIQSSNGSGSLQKSLKNAKKAVDRYVGSYLKEYGNVKPHLDEGCNELTKVLENHPKSSIQKVNENTPEARDQIVKDAIAQVAEWALEYEKQTQTAEVACQESLSALCKGLTEMSSNLAGIRDGSVQSPNYPDLDSLVTKCQGAFTKQHKILSEDRASNAGYAKTMNKFIPAIITVLDMKAAADKSAREYAEIFQYPK